MNEKIKTEVLNFLTKGDNSVQINSDINLLKEGYLDSFGIMELVELIEELSGEEFDPDVLLAENFTSLNDIYRTVDQVVK